jgi:hypothetical protein
MTLRAGIVPTTRDDDSVGSMTGVAFGSTGSADGGYNNSC